MSLFHFILNKLHLGTADLVPNEPFVGYVVSFENDDEVVISCVSNTAGIESTEKILYRIDNSGQIVDKFEPVFSKKETEMVKYVK
jgi:hypothetical protein